MADLILSSRSDESLAAQARDGSSAAAAALAVRMAPVVKSLASRYKSAGEADDLAQEGMIGLLSAIGSFNPSNGASFRTYAMVCIGNRIVSAVRKNMRSRETAAEIIEADDTELISGGGDDPQNIVVGQTEADRLMEVLTASLSKFERDVLRLYLSGERYAVIASQLSATPKSVDNALQRIRKKLRSFQ